MSNRKQQLSYLKVLLSFILLQFAFSQKMHITSSSQDAIKAYKKALLLRDNIQLEAAQKEFKKALHLDPNFLLAKLGLAQSQRGFKRRNELMKELIAMAKNAAVSKGERIFINGRIAAFHGERKKAQDAIKKLAKLFPNDERIQYNLGLFHYGNRDYKKAIMAFEGSVNANPNFEAVYNLLGYTYRFVGNRKAAEHAFKKGIELNPKNPNAYDSYAELLLKMGQYEKSIKTYEKALKSDPLFPSAVMGIASNLLHLKRYDEARERLDKAMKIAPNDGIRSGICWALSVTYLDQGDYKNAIKELENNLHFSEKAKDKQSIAVDKQNIAGIYLAEGKLKKAAAYFHEAYKLNLAAAANEQLRKNIEHGYLSQEAILALQENDLNKAKEKTQAFMEAGKKENNPFMLRFAHELRGRIALKEGRYKKAIEEIEQGNKTDAYNIFRIAQAYEGLGEMEKAREMYRYVSEYRSSLNYNYSLVRHQAEKKLMH